MVKLLKRVLLQFEINVENDVFPGYRWNIFYGSNDTASAIYLNLLIAFLTMKYIFVVSLNTKLTDDSCRLIIRFFALFF